MKKIIVGVCGEIHHGKSTLAQHITDYLNLSAGAPYIPSIAEIRKIAAPLYIAGEALVGEPVQKEKVYQVGDRRMTGRQLLQELADHFRAMDRRSLVQSVVNYAEASPHRIFFCDDVRTPECSSICDFLIGVVCRNRGASGETHETEQYVQDHLSKARFIVHWTDDGSGNASYEEDVFKLIPDLEEVVEQRNLERLKDLG